MLSRTQPRISVIVAMSAGLSDDIISRWTTSTWPGSTFSSSARPAGVSVTCTLRSSSSPGVRVTSSCFSSWAA
jgi:hypothetical protein